MGPQVWHVRGQVGGADVMQAEFLEAGRINQGAGLLFVHPIPGRAGGCVLARIQRLRDFARLGQGPRNPQIDQGALARARWPEHQGLLLFELLPQDVSGGVMGVQVFE